MSNVNLGGHPKFYEVRRTNEKLYSQKHYQYATDADPMSNFRLCGQLIHKLLKPGVNPTVAAALTLMSKQIVGVYEIVGEGKQDTIESLEDKLKDIEIYASIIQVLVDETKNTTPEIKDGPYCNWCDQLADFRDEVKGAIPAVLTLCSNCAAERNIDTTNWTLLGRL